MRKQNRETLSEVQVRKLRNIMEARINHLQNLYKEAASRKPADTETLYREGQVDEAKHWLKMFNRALEVL